MTNVLYENLVASYEWNIQDENGLPLDDHMVTSFTITVQAHGLSKVEFTILPKRAMPMPNTIILSAMSPYGTARFKLEKISREKVDGYIYKNIGQQEYQAVGVHA